MVKKSSKSLKLSSENHKLEELLKDLLILELGRSGFSRKQIRRILGKISNARISRILPILRKGKK